MGCLEYRYNPFLSGCEGGAFGQFTITTIMPANPNSAMGTHLHNTMLSLILREEKWNRW